MTPETYRCAICGTAVVPAPGLVCPLHLPTSEWHLLDEQAGSPSAWVLGGEGPATARPAPTKQELRPPAVQQADAPLKPEEVVLASFSQRLVAFLIDLPMAAMLALVFAAFASASPLAATVAGLVGFWTYFLMSNSLGQLVGKAALGIKVIDPVTGREPGFAKGALRTVGQVMSLFLTLGLGFLMMIEDERRMTLHDHLAGTIVVRTTEAER